MIEEVGKRYHTATIYRFIEASNYSLQVLQEKAIQKSRYEQNVYRGTMMSLSKGKDPSIFCFVDESAVGKNAARRRRGWARRGRPATKYTMFEEDTGGNRHRYTLIGCVDINGFVEPACEIVFQRTGKKQLATGTIDQHRFVQYVAECLVPTLGCYELGEPRSVVVMDNARIHKDPRVRQLIEAAGAKLVWNAACVSLSLFFLFFFTCSSLLTLLLFFSLLLSFSPLPQLLSRAESNRGMLPSVQSSATS